MSNIIALTKVLLKGVVSPASSKTKKVQSKKSTTVVYSLIFIMLIACFIPFAMQAKDLTSLIGESGSSLLLQMLVILNTIVLLMVSLMSNVTILFFSKDNEVLMHMPFKPKEIYFARTIISLVSCYFLSLLFFLPTAIGVGIGLNMGATFYISLVVTTILLPILPCFISSFVVLLFTKYFNIFKNKDVLTYLTMIIGIGVGLGFSFGLEYLMPSIENVIDPNEIIDNYKIFINSISWFVPYSIPLMKIATFTTAILDKLLFFVGIMGIGALFIYLSGLVADKIYYPALLKVNGNGVKKKKFTQKAFVKETHTRSINRSLIKREFSVIVRTPIFLINMILPLVMIVFTMVTLAFAFNEIDGSEIGRMFNNVDSFLPIVCIVFGGICCFMNTAAPTMYSKDGSTCASLHFLPISFSNIFFIKVLVGFLFAAVPYLISFALLEIILKFAILDVIFPFALGLLVILAASFVGTFIDLLRPKIKWNNETEAIKTNFNVFLYIIFAIIYTIICAFIKNYAFILCVVTISFVIIMLFKKEYKLIDNLS